MPENSTQKEYNQQINFLQSQIGNLIKKEKQTSMFRFLTFILSIGLFYFFISANNPLAFLCLFFGMLAFAFILVKNKNIILQRKLSQDLMKVCVQELSSIEGDYHFFPNGTIYKNKKHPYTSDLDIFGEGSLFQYLNRTSSFLGSNRLAEMLNAPSQYHQIKLNQEAIQELAMKRSWRHSLIVNRQQFNDQKTELEATLDFLSEDAGISTNKGVLQWALFLTFLIFTIGIASFFGLPIVFLILMIGINMVVFPKYKKILGTTHQQVTQISKILDGYRGTIGIIVKEDFKTQKLSDLKNTFQADGMDALFQIKKLAQIVRRFDYSLNAMISFPLNILFFWDIWQMKALDNWKLKTRTHFPLWLKTMAEFEALMCFGNFSDNHASWVFPNINQGPFLINAVNMGHPLIPENRMVRNSFRIEGDKKVFLITGSNMSGKSTFLRTVGINIVLAMTGAPVCANELSCSNNILIHSSMRITDSLEENTSSFYAELKRLREILDSVEKNKDVFLLLDEILRGTNSNDRHIGSAALIRQLLKNGAKAIIATHDLDLATLENELPDQIENYNFDVRVEKDELYFDYKLHQGVCNSLNASILMRKMGIDL